MGKMTEIVRVARKYIGYDYSHFTAEFGGGVWAWCAAFISVIGKESGNSDVIPRSTSCNEQIRVFKAQNAWLGKTTDIRVGDVLYYDWDFKAEPLPADHVGLVVEVNGNMIKVIEGNKGDGGSASTVVGVREISKSYDYIFGIARPKYAVDSVPEADKIVSVELRQLSSGMKGKDVEAMQAILIAKGYSCGTYGSDGEFGGCTTDAVKNFQLEHNLTVDGICGPKTWKELINR